VTYEATHLVPEQGLPAFAGPDASVPAVASLDPWLDVQLLDHRGGWAHIVCSNGWEAWVDRRYLIDRRLLGQSSGGATFLDDSEASSGAPTSFHPAVARGTQQPGSEYVAALGIDTMRRLTAGARDGRRLEVVVGDRLLEVADACGFIAPTLEQLVDPLVALAMSVIKPFGGQTFVVVERLTGDLLESLRTSWDLPRSIYHRTSMLVGPVVHVFLRCLHAEGYLIGRELLGTSGGPPREPDMELFDATLARFGAFSPSALVESLDPAFVDLLETFMMVFVAREPSLFELVPEKNRVPAYRLAMHRGIAAAAAEDSLVESRDCARHDMSSPTPQ
jgi:hypothetical protein